MGFKGHAVLQARAGLSAKVIISTLRPYRVRV